MPLYSHTSRRVGAVPRRLFLSTTTLSFTADALTLTFEALS
jgi:hypothetical protein